MESRKQQSISTFSVGDPCIILHFSHCYWVGGSSNIYYVRCVFTEFTLKFIRLVWSILRATRTVHIWRTLSCSPYFSHPTTHFLLRLMQDLLTVWAARRKKTLSYANPQAMPKCSLTNLYWFYWSLLVYHPMDAQVCCQKRQCFSRFQLWDAKNDRTQEATCLTWRHRHWTHHPSWLLTGNALVTRTTKGLW